jgi:nucleoporin POM152
MFPPPPRAPRVPETWLDVPSQRLYVLSIGLLCQAFKLLDFITYLATSWEVQTNYTKKWLLVDLLYILALVYLRIPRITFSKSVVALQILVIWLLNGIMFGGITLNLFGAPVEASSVSHLPATPVSYGMSYWLSLGLLSNGANGQKDDHLLGQHTIRMSPISTAQFNPSFQTFCLESPSASVFIPVLLNNTSPIGLAYTITPLGHVVGGEKSERIALSAKDLKSMEQAHMQLTTQTTKATNSVPEPSASGVVYEYDDDDDDTEEQESGTRPTLQKSQSMVYIRVSKPGTIQLERVRDISNVDARISPYPARLTVVHCPRVEFTYDPKADKGEDVRCLGKERDIDLPIDVKGVPPLSLRWYKTLNGRRESFLVEGIEGDRLADQDVPETRTTGIVQKEQNIGVHLSATLGALGSHVYVLEEVIDALGNTVRMDSLYPQHVDRTSWNQIQTETTRSLSVLGRPAVSFRSCGPNKPVPMKIGKSVPLTLSISDANSLDSPWEVDLIYTPEEAAKGFAPWKKSFVTEGEKRQLTIEADGPGIYSISNIHGKWCEGDVLTPETCTVFEQPMPTAEISWERIHECSGDIGVSSTIVLHGTPPFVLHYTTRKDKERPQEQQKTISNFRSEILLKPEKSGRYVYTFTHLSDANYKKTELKGENLSIEQVVHPLATASFVSTGSPAKNAKRKISSCEGSIVDVDVALSGSGPFNLELQVVGPQGSEIMKVLDIKTHQKTINVQIPKVVDRDGGNFEIDLVSVEDSNGCKKSLSVPGVSVSVRRVKPTARFYTQDGKRQVTVTAREPVNLPMRLTGEKPWTVTYRRLDGKGREKTAKIDSPNGSLRVAEDGVYEIVDVSDAQCAGTVIEPESKYVVEWIPRPYATLSTTTPAEYEPHNNSHILRGVCAGIDDHVELDLSGKPPFQIMYNIAKGNDMGSTELINRPVFNSIQPRTKFQLHTSSPGRMFYEVKQIGDVAYPLESHKDAVIPRSQRLLFEQPVFKRPSAMFRSRSRVGMCLGDAFILGPTSPSSLSEGSIMLSGSPPFTLTVSIKDLATSSVDQLDVEVHDPIWKINLPGYQFKSVGPHLVTIENVQDASGCTHETLDPLARSIWVDVSETASIMPSNGKTDYCVGEVSQFQLEGTPPWTIGYKINGKAHTQDAKVSPFSLVQQQPGEFVINSVSHQQKKCKAAVTDLRFAVHQLPSAQVGHGKRIIQDIHEGDQAEIVFTLIGEPPFTFTYQRSESTTKKGQRGRVLETHTVSRVNTHEYSIYSALEGTWTVVSIADKYCRYPPLQQEIQ